MVERLGRTWPRISAKRHAILAYSPLLLALVIAPIGLGIVIAVGLVVLLHRHHDFVEAWHGPVAAKACRIVLVMLLVAATFSAGSAGLDILDA